MKPLILITNDDGISSPGLLAAVEAVEGLGEIVVAAPHTQQTGMGRSFLRTEETGKIEKAEMLIHGRQQNAYKVHGSPAFSVAHGVLELSERKPDLCISGINYGENVGTTVTCSGTLGAVFEANSYGIPGIAVSVEADLKFHRSSQFMKMDWTEAQNILRLWTKRVLEEGMPKGVDLWNINVPASAVEPGSYRITTQSMQNYIHFIRPGKRELERPFRLDTMMRIDEDVLEKESDIYAVHVDRITSVTPMSLDLSVKL